MDRGSGVILRETQVPQAINKVVLETTHFWNMVSDEEGLECLGDPRPAPYSSGGVSTERVGRAAWPADSRAFGPLPALGTAFF